MASKGQESIAWHYDATGRKLRKASGDNSVTYIDGIEKYDNSSTFIQHPEGRSAVIPNGEHSLPWHVEFTLRDHLGNTRVAFSDLNEDGQIQLAGTDPSGVPLPAEYTELLQENHYYPFGLNMEGQWYPPQKAAWENKYQYNGKEFNDDLGLNWNDYGARWYDAAICRFTGVDPIADEFVNLSAFNYASNEPVANIDLHGLQGLHFMRVSGRIAVTQGVYGADFKILGAKTGMVITLDGKDMVGIEGSIDKVNGGQGKITSFFDDTGKLGIEGGKIIGGGYELKVDRENNTREETGKLNLGVVELQTKSTQDVSTGKSVSENSVGGVVGGKAGIGLIGVEAELRIDIVSPVGEDSKPIPTDTNEQRNLIQRDHHQEIILPINLMQNNK